MVSFGPQTCVTPNKRVGTMKSWVDSGMGLFKSANVSETNCVLIIRVLL
jgi:hypothetical protein